MSNILNVVSKLQINLPGYSADIRKESDYFFKHITQAYASWLKKYDNGVNILPGLKTSDLDYSLELTCDFLLLTSDLNWADTLVQKVDTQIKLIEQIGNLYQHYLKIKSNPVGHAPISHIFKPNFNIPTVSSTSSRVCLLDEELTDAPNFCFELAFTVKSGPLAEYQLPIILYIVNNNESEYVDATYLPDLTILAYDAHRISLEKTNLKDMSVSVLPNICSGTSLILNVLNRLSPHASLLSLVSEDDENAAIAHVKTVLLMSNNISVLENTEPMPVFE